MNLSFRCEAREKTTNKDKIVREYNGEKKENEDIEVVELHYLQFRSMMDSDIKDSKTKLLAYESHYRNLFD